MTLMGHSTPPDGSLRSPPTDISDPICSPLTDTKDASEFLQVASCTLSNKSI